MSQSVLITGGAGAIGTSITKALLGDGHRVTILDDLSSGLKSNIPEGVEFIQGSVANIDAVEKAFSTSKPHYLIHAAAFFANQNSVDHPQTDLLVNGMGTLNVLEAAKKYRVTKTLYFSSSCIYGSSEEMSETTTSFFPETPYAITKLLGERYVQFYVHHHKMDIVTIRLFNTYGPGERPGKYRNVIPNFIHLAMQGKPLPITGTGQETRSFLFVEDAVYGILEALKTSTKPGAIFNISSHTETKISDLAQLINEITGNPAGVQYLPRRNWDGVTRRKPDFEKARNELGFAPKTDLRSGIEKTFKWLEEIFDQNQPNTVTGTPSAPKTRRGETSTVPGA